MADPLVKVLDSVPIATSGAESTGHQHPGDALSIQLSASAPTGAPSVVLSVQWSDDGVNYSPASPADAFAAITAAGSVVQRFTTKAAFWRLAWTFSGSGSLPVTVHAYT